MSRLTSIIPDVQVLIDLSAQELAFPLLQLAYEHKQNELIHPQALLQQMHGNPSIGIAGYPGHRIKEAELAFAEAWNWLTVQGLLIEDPGGNGSNGHMRFSRAAMSLLQSKKFDEYAKAVSFPKSLLHPAIAEQVWIDLVRGDLETAVFKAFKAVEIAVRRAGGFAATDIGVALMRKAFNAQQGPLTDLQQPEAERDALASLFAGAIGSYKNPHSHRTVAIQDASDAQEMVLLASHLLRIVDTRIDRSPH